MAKKSSKPAKRRYDPPCMFGDLGDGEAFAVPNYVIRGCKMIKLPSVQYAGDTAIQNTLCIPPKGAVYLTNVSGHVMVRGIK